jgi:hypothetical protein
MRRKRPVPDSAPPGHRCCGVRAGWALGGYQIKARSGRTIARAVGAYSGGLEIPSRALRVSEEMLKLLREDATTDFQLA